MLSHKNRWDVFKTSIFSIMSEAALKNSAINLAQGFPSFSGPDAVKQAAMDAIAQDRNQYAPAPGIRELRVALSERQQQTAKLNFDPDQEITIFSGATEAIFSCLLAHLSPGDECITFEPFYDSYPAAAFAAGAKMVAVTLQPPTWSFEKADLLAKCNAKTKAILLNTPHNPTGKVFSEQEMHWIAEVADQFNLLVITDEVYEEIIFSPAKHLFFAALPGMRKRTITISSTSKTFSMTGWKVGYTFASPELTRPMRTVHQFSVFCSATPLQYGMLAGLALPKSYYEQLRKDYLQRRDTLMGVLRDAGFKPAQCSGSYFILADYSAHSDVNDYDFAHELCAKAKIAAIPISGFYSDVERAKKDLRYLRFAFCKDMATLAAAKNNFAKFGYQIK